MAGNISNPRIGEIEIEVRTVTYTMRPSFTVMTAIERLADGSYQNVFKLNSLINIATAFHIAIKANHGKDTPTLDDVGEAVMRMGQSAAFNLLLKFLEPVLIGYDEAAKKRAQRDDDGGSNAEGNVAG